MIKATRTKRSSADSNDDHMMAGRDTEYTALRQEMLRRLDLIHNTLEKGVTVSLVSIGFGLNLSGSNSVKPVQVAILVQFLLFLIVLYVYDQYKITYRVGTYLAFTHEHNDVGEPRWHRMSRRFGDSVPTPRAGWKWLGLGRWGGSAALTGTILCFLTVVNFVALVPIESLSSACVPRENAFALILGLATLAAVWWLLWRLDTYTKNTEAMWKPFHYETFKTTYGKFYEK